MNRRVNELEKKVQEMELKLEIQERQRKINNVLITGLRMDISNRKVQKETTKNLINQGLEVEVEVKSAFRIEEKSCIIEVNNWDD